MQMKVDGCRPYGVTLAHNTVANTTNLTQHVVCTDLTNRDYVDFMWTTFSEFPGFFVVWLLIERVGRRWSLFLMYGVGCLSFLSLAICTTRQASMVFVFVSRSSISGAYLVVYIIHSGGMIYHKPFSYQVLG